MAAALANVEEDSWEWHTFDTVKGGDYLVDQDAAEILAKEAIDAVIDLENMGLPFNRTPEGKIDQRRFGGHTGDHGKSARASRVLRRRPHGPHDPADAVPELRQARHQLLQRVLRARPRHDQGRRRASSRRASSPTSSPPASCTSSRRRRSSSPPAASARSTRPPRTPTRSRATASASSGARACRSRTWSSSSSTRPASPASASCSPRAPAARARSCATPRASASWSATPRPSRTSRRATSSPAAWCRRSREGRGAGPHRDYVLLDCTHLGAEVLETKLPDITEFARTYLGVDPVRRARAGHADRALRDGRHPDQQRRPGAERQHHRRARPLRRRRVRVRVGARLEPPRHQLAARHQRVRQARRPQRGASTSRPPTSCRSPTTPPPRCASCSRACATTGHRAHRRAPQEAAGRDGPQGPGVPHRRVAGRGTDVIAELRERYRNIARRRQGQAVQHRPARGRRAGLPARPRRGRRRTPPATARRAAAATCATTSPSATTRTTCSTRWPTCRGMRTPRPRGPHPARLEARRHHDATSRWRGSTDDGTRD